MASHDSIAGPRHGGSPRLGLALLGGGALLLAMAGGFFAYQAYIDSRYDAEVRLTTAPTLPSQQELFAPLAPAPPVDTTAAPDDAATLADFSPGTSVAPQGWVDPMWAVDLGQAKIAAAYLPLSELDLPAGGLGPATRVRIPIIGVDAPTIELGLFPFEGGLKYESPVDDVGIIAGVANPGEVGNTWLFGHLESPIRGEGAVFRELPRIHDFLRQGEAVYVIVDSVDGSFLYQATQFRILPKEDVHYWESDERIATLVCSWPRFKYDERVVVTAELVGAQLHGEAVS